MPAIVLPRLLFHLCFENTPHQLEDIDDEVARLRFWLTPLQFHWVDDQPTP
jgi:hypothetical protein